MIREINYSLIGWYLQMYGMQNAFAFIQWLGVPLFADADNLSWLQPKSPLRNANDDDFKRKLNNLLDGYSTFEQRIKYNFRNKAYLLQSVTHESFTSNDITPNYHGLDFVGDAILNYTIVRHLFRQPIQLNADELADLSTLLYSNSSLATVFVRNDLHKYLRYTTPEIRDNINSFVALVRRNKFRPVDDVCSDIFQLFSVSLFSCKKNTNYFDQSRQIYFLDKKNFVFEVPPIISSCFEAIVAAIYFDSLMDLNAVSSVRELFCRLRFTSLSFY